MVLHLFIAKQLGKYLIRKRECVEASPLTCPLNKSKGVGSFPALGDFVPVAFTFF